MIVHKVVSDDHGATVFDEYYAECDSCLEKLNDEESFEAVVGGIDRHGWEWRRDGWKWRNASHPILLCLCCKSLSTEEALKP